MNIGQLSIAICKVEVNVKLETIPTNICVTGNPTPCPLVGSFVRSSVEKYRI